MTKEKLLKCGWNFVDSNDEGVEVWEQGKEELFYHAPSQKILGVFTKEFIRRVYEKAKKA